MQRNRTVRELLREKDRFYLGELARRDEMIQSLLDRIQHPDRTPVWREAPPPLQDEPVMPFIDPYEFEGSTVV